jgi:hypothetical protein
MQCLSIFVFLVAVFIVYAVGNGNFAKGLERSSVALLIGGFGFTFIMLSSTPELSLGWFGNLIIGAIASLVLWFMVALGGGIIFGTQQPKSRSSYSGHNYVTHEHQNARIRELEDRIDELEDELEDRDDDYDDWDYDDKDEDDYWNRRARDY